MKHIARLFHFQTVAKLAVLVFTCTTVALAWFSPASLTFRLIESGAGYGRGTLIVMTVLAALALVDTIYSLSTLAPEALEKYVPTIYSALGATYFLQSFVLIGHSAIRGDVLATGYLANGLVCAILAGTIAVRGDDHAT